MTVDVDDEINTFAGKIKKKPPIELVYISFISAESHKHIEIVTIH